jgi:predicted transglutaminase-like protease
LGSTQKKIDNLWLQDFPDQITKKRRNRLTYENKSNTICKETGKICYSKRMANELVNSQKHHKKKNIRINKGGKMPLRSYYCEHCGCYHLTSSPFYREVRYDLNKKHPLKEI